MADGVLSLPWWGVVVVALALTHFTIVAVTIYLHRAQAHRALDLHPAVAHVFRFWLWLTTGMITREWVAVHRKHHARCETPDDPHSPQVLGLRRVLWGGAELYRSASRDRKTIERFGHGTPDDRIERALYTRHPNLGIVLMLLLDLVLFGVVGITVWAVQMLWIPFWAAGVVNGLGHYWGYRNYEPKDAATNVFPWGIIIGGEELHNNHHAYPSSARLSCKWWELDIGWAYIRLLQWAGLARVKKVAPRPRRDPSKHEVDAETVRAMVVSRLHVMADFGRQVVHPVLREELRRADRAWRYSLRRVRALLVREHSRLKAPELDRLQGVLARSEALRVVYDHRARLQSLWDRTSASQEKLVAALQEWCRQAEASGVSALQDFARSLRGYVLRPV